MVSDRQILVFLDQRDGLWHFISRHLSSVKLPFLRAPSSFEFKDHPQVLDRALCFIIFWENRQRHPGVLIELIKEHSKNNVAQKIIVLTANPAHEDVIYFSELGLEKILKVSLTLAQPATTVSDFNRYLRDCIKPPPMSPLTQLICKLEEYYDRDEEDVEAGEMALALEEKAEAELSQPLQARTLDIRGCLADISKDEITARKKWLEAIESNPSYYRAYNHLIVHYLRAKNYADALALLKKMHGINKNNIKRLRQLAFAYLNNGDEQHARHFFQSILEKDPGNAAAINGLAKIHFNQGELLLCRQVIDRTLEPDKLASLLNQQGISYLNAGKFQQALDHYLKASFVLTQQEKSHLIFYNIALCFYRCKDLLSSKVFVGLSLAKSPSFSKSKKLLESIAKAPSPS